MSVGERSLHRDGARLHIDEILAFLWECFQDQPDAVYCGFYLGYDFSQWVRTLPQDRAHSLFNANTRRREKSGGNTTPFPVYYTAADRTEWELDLLASKRFKLRKKDSKEWLFICDVGGFFQQPFVSASALYDEKGKPNWTDKTGALIEIATPDEMEIIERGKKARATAKFDKAMMQYNCAENRVLSRMMKTLAEGFKEMGVRLRRSEWYGPGQVAQKWMDQHAKSHASKAIRAKAEQDDLFRCAVDAARSAYFGGWFETMAHGHVGNAFEYDISSAYPHIHSGLPCILHGTWQHVQGRDAAAVADPWTLFRCDVRGDNPHIGAMLHRDKQGRINRPNFTSGWYWKHEIEAAERAGLICEKVVHEALGYTPCNCEPPMRDLRELYQQRLSVGKSTPQGRGLKLCYNSCYGKCAQSVGLPKYANSLHASLITAGCRAMICDAIATHPNGARDVLMIATDGIYFRSQHPGLENLPAELGSWESAQKRNLSIFLPGIYWDDYTREQRAKKVIKLKSRGISGKDLIERLDILDDKFDAMLEPISWRMFEGDVSPDWWPKLEVPLGFSMVSPKQALQRGKWDLCGTIKQAEIRELWAHPRHKRLEVLEASQEFPYVRTTPPTNPLEVPSTPYSKEFGMEWDADQIDEFSMLERDSITESFDVIKGA